MPQEKNMNDVIEEIKSYKEKLKKAGQITGDETEIPEDIKKGAGYILYDQIADTTIEILQQPTVIEPLNRLCDHLGDDLAKDLTELLAVVMTHSAYGAVVVYDDLLKIELNAQLNRMVEAINTIAADNNACKGVLEVNRNRMDDIEKRITVLENK